MEFDEDGDEVVNYLYDVTDWMVIKGAVLVDEDGDPITKPESILHEVAEQEPWPQAVFAAIREEQFAAEPSPHGEVEHDGITIRLDEEAFFVDEGCNDPHYRARRRCSRQSLRDQVGNLPGIQRPHGQVGGKSRNVHAGRRPRLRLE
jgi:hypothetical protein